MVTTIVHKISEIKQRGTESPLVTDVAADFESLLKLAEAAFCLCPIAPECCRFHSDWRLHRAAADAALNGKGFLEIAQCLFGLA